MIAEALAGGAFQECDAFLQSVAQTTPGMGVIVDEIGAQPDRQNERRRHGDGVNEQRMREAIDAVAAGRTLIVIAHRLSTVVDSDRIVVLDRGEVVGQGTHSELVGTTPLYRDLAKHQLLV